MKSYTTLRNQFGTLSANTSSTNLTLADELINDSLRYLTTKYFFNEKSVVVPGGTIASQQSYNLPYNIKTLISVYISVGNIRYTLTESPNRTFWDSINFVPYTSDIPQFYYIFNKKMYVFPTPAGSGNAITYNYKRRIKDLSEADYDAGTALATTADATVTGTATTWTKDMAGRWIRFTSDLGDEEWYEIASVTDTTHLELVNQYAGATMTGTGDYVIGEMPLLAEDYHDLPVYRALSIYFTTRVPDPTRAELFDKLYKEGREELDAEFGSKSWSVAITPADQEVNNPNLFTRSLS